MKNFNIKYKVSFEAKSRLGGKNQFEVDYSIRSLLRVAILQLKDIDSSFSRLFKDGNYDIDIQLEEFDEEQDNKKLKSQLCKLSKSENLQNRKK